MRRLLWGLFIATFIFVAPHLWLRATTPIVTPQEAKPAAAALIFGAVVRDGTITPLQKERLDAALALHAQGTVPLVVVSNTVAAAQVMAAYLLANGLSQSDLSLDTGAERSPDTCAEAARRGLKTALYVSQKFHLPRLRMHCQRYGIAAQFIMADSPDRAPAPFSVKLRVRTERFIRESVLIWGTLLRVYPHQTLGARSG